MTVLQRIIPIAVSLALTAATTAILFYVHMTATAPHRLVYFYLLPLVVIAMLHNGRLALVCAGIAAFCADYFLQDPIYSLYNTNVLEYGDLICFAALAALSIKATRKLLPQRPSGRPRTAA
jgi:K+-sensing histidine kinase KdpD